MKINWKVRAKNKVFWIALIPAVLLLVSQVLALFGITFDYEKISGQLVDIVGTAFVVLTILGIVADPTTDGMMDSDLAMIYCHEDEHPEISAMGRGEE
ncbi:MAG: phage holin [Prevotella sp.]|nr:phage holin [Prevotella sp.]